MAPTKKQLAARLNPQPFTINVPTTGLFRGTGDIGGLFKREGDKITAIDFTNVLIPDNEERRKFGNFGGQSAEAKRRLKKQFGIDFESLPEVNLGDLGSSRASVTPPGQKLAPRLRGLPGYMQSITDINQFLGVSPAQLKEAQQNTQKNLLGATEQPLASEGGLDLTTPDLAQFGNFDRQLQFGMSGEDVKRLQQFLNASGFEVGKEGTAGSIGNETEFFGPKTQKALQEYQKAQGIVSKGDPKTTGFGRLGPQTLEAVNKLTVPPQDVGGDIGADTDAEGLGGDTGAVGEDITPDVSQQIKDTQTEEDIGLEEFLATVNISEDEKDLARTLFTAQSSFDADMRERLEAGFRAAKKRGEPFFNAQIRLVEDELTRGFSKLEDQLEIDEQLLTKNLAQLREDVGLAKSRGSIEEQSQLSQLEKALGLKLESTRQNLATSGFTSSSRRARSEELLRETTGELRESTQRGFAQKREDLTTALTRGETGTAEELKRLADLTKKGKIDLSRRAEERLGTKELSGFSGFTPLGGGDIAGTLTRERQEDIRTAAKSFVF